MAQHTAIVIGSGMAGLATAQALSKHFDRVLVLERDVDPASDPAIVNKSAVEVASMKPPARPGVSQVNAVPPMFAHCRQGRLLHHGEAYAFARLVKWHGRTVLHPS